MSNTKATKIDTPEAEIILYPYMKRTKSLKLPKTVHKENLEVLSQHITKQIIHQLVNHGFKVNAAFQRDLDMVHESLRSAVFRSFGIHHELQEYIDEIYEDSPDSKLKNIKGIIEDDVDTEFFEEEDISS